MPCFVNRIRRESLQSHGIGLPPLPPSDGHRNLLSIIQKTTKRSNLTSSELCKLVWAPLSGRSRRPSRCIVAAFASVGRSVQTVQRMAFPPSVASNPLTRRRSRQPSALDCPTTTPLSAEDSEKRESCESASTSGVYREPVCGPSEREALRGARKDAAFHDGKRCDARAAREERPSALADSRRELRRCPLKSFRSLALFREVAEQQKGSCCRAEAGRLVRQKCFDGQRTEVSRKSQGARAETLTAQEAEAAGLTPSLVRLGGRRLFKSRNSNGQRSLLLQERRARSRLLAADASSPQTQTAQNMQTSVLLSAECLGSKVESPINDNEKLLEDRLIAAKAPLLWLEAALSGRTYTASFARDVRRRQFPSRLPAAKADFAVEPSKEAATILRAVAVAAFAVLRKRNRRLRVGAPPVSLQVSGGKWARLAFCAKRHSQRKRISAGLRFSGEKQSSLINETPGDEAQIRLWLKGMHAGTGEVSKAERKFSRAIERACGRRALRPSPQKARHCLSRRQLRADCHERFVSQIEAMCSQSKIRAENPLSMQTRLECLSRRHQRRHFPAFGLG